MRIKKLAGGKAKGGLAAVVLSFGLVLAGCDTGLAVPDVSTADADTSGNVTASVSGSPSPAAAYPARNIKVKFEIKNGGITGLWESRGIVSVLRPDCLYLVKDKNMFSKDFTISTIAPADCKYAGIFWMGTEASGAEVAICASLRIDARTDYTIVIDYEGQYSYPVTKNLVDVFFLDIKKFDLYWAEAVWN